MYQTNHSSYFRHWMPEIPKQDFIEKNLGHLFRYPIDTLTWARSNEVLAGKRVLVVGGGISGLTSAYELTRQGAQVTLVEGSSRFGGRIHTYRFHDELGREQPEWYGELGAARIPPVHSLVFEFMWRELGLTAEDVVPFPGEDRRAFFEVEGTRFRQGDAEALWKHLNRPEAEVKLGFFQNRPPNKLIEDMIDTEWARIPDTDKWQLPFAGWCQGDLAPITGELLDKSFRQALIQFFEDHFEDEKTVANRRAWNELIQLYGWTTGLVHFFNASAVSVLFLEKMIGSPRKFTLRGGMDTLVHRLVAKLQKLGVTLMRNVTVESIQNSEAGIKITFTSTTSGQEQILETFDYVVVAVPPKQVLAIQFKDENGTSGLPPRKRLAYQDIHVSSSSKALALCEEPFWRAYGLEGGGCTRTDQLPQQIFYPIGRREDGPSGPVVLTCGYMWEDDSRTFAGYMSDPRKRKTIVDCVESIHKNATGKIRDVKWTTWDERNGGGGGYAFYAPGQQVLHQAEMMAPYRGRIYFAGEHLALPHGWIQTAMQSAIGAILDLAEHALGRALPESTNRADIECLVPSIPPPNPQAELVADYLVHKIRDNDITAATRVTPEEIAALLEVDVQDVRCAFDHVEGRGLLTTLVVPVDDEYGYTRFHVGVRSSFEYVKAMMRQRIALETANCEEIVRTPAGPEKAAALRGIEEALDYLSSIMTGAEAEPDLHRKRVLLSMYFEEEYRFHEQIASAAQRNRARTSIRRITDASYVLWHCVEIEGKPLADQVRDLEEAVRWTHRQHREILEQFQMATSSADASLRMTEHLQATLDSIERSYRLKPEDIPAYLFPPQGPEGALSDRAVSRADFLFWQSVRNGGR